MKPRLLTFAASLLSLLTGPARAEVYPPVPADVSFDQVLALPATAPAARYRYGEAASQFAELWVPGRPLPGRPMPGRPMPGRPVPAPVVVFIHGGCWLNAYGIDHTRALASALAAEGYAVWSLEYRRVGDAGGGWPGSFEDIRAGIARLSQLDEPALDTDRVLLMGHSAGGHLALLAGSALAATPVQGLRLRGVVGLAAIADIASYAAGTGSCQSAAVQFMGGTPDQRPVEYRLANPVQQSPHANTVLLQGRADRIVPAAQAEAAGLPVQWLDGAGHFDLIHPGTPAWTEVLATLGRLLP